MTQAKNAQLDCKKDKTMKDVVTVTSAGASGASAITGYLVDYDDCFSMGYELDIFRGPGGIYELYKTMDSNDLFLTHEVFIKFDALKERIINTIKVCEANYYPQVASVARQGATDEIKKLLDSFQDSFIEIVFEWATHCYGMDFANKYGNMVKFCHYDSSSFSGQIGNFLIKLAEIINAKNPVKAEIDFSLFPQKTCLKKSNVDSRVFLKIARKFLEDVMKIISNKKTFIWLCLLTSNRVSAFEEQSVFFENLKMIFVTRDPRDTFTGWRKRNWLTDEQVEIFIKIYKYLHLDYPYNHDKIFDLRFEDFVLNHEETSQNILNFIGISKGSKVTNHKYNVEDSKKNIGRWKSYPNQKCMDKIAVELKDYLYET